MNRFIKLRIENGTSIETISVNTLHIVYVMSKEQGKQSMLSFSNGNFLNVIDSYGEVVKLLDK